MVDLAAKKAERTAMAVKAEMNNNKEFSPKEIREMFGISNSQIQQLCKYADIKLKRNNMGFTYFTLDDVKTLKNITLDNCVNKSSLPAVKKEQPAEKPVATADYLKQVLDSIGNFEKTVTEKITAVLDEKLDGMDDVVMELIRVKTENENMRFKINELNKENYKLKKELNSFKKIPFGFYTKTAQESEF